jgi:shikimate 5-dehydrogenase
LRALDETVRRGRAADRPSRGRIALILGIGGVALALCVAFARLAFG